MTITEVQILPVKPKDGIVAFASVVFDGLLYLGSIAVHKKLNGNGYRITYPTKKVGERDMNIYYPINKTASVLIETAITEKIERMF